MNKKRFVFTFEIIIEPTWVFFPTIAATLQTEKYKGGIGIYFLNRIFALTYITIPKKEVA